MIKNNIGDNIKFYRKRAKMYQSEVGKKLGVNANTVSSWEVNRTEPNMGQVQKMAEMFGCTPEELIGYVPNVESIMTLKNKDNQSIIFEVMKDKELTKQLEAFAKFLIEQKRKGD